LVWRVRSSARRGCPSSAAVKRRRSPAVPPPMPRTSAQAGPPPPRPLAARAAALLAAAGRGSWRAAAGAAAAARRQRAARALEVWPVRGAGRSELPPLLQPIVFERGRKPIVCTLSFVLRVKLAHTRPHRRRAGAAAGPARFAMRRLPAPAAAACAGRALGRKSLRREGWADLRSEAKAQMESNA
jgi:hypothetical protein